VNVLSGDGMPAGHFRAPWATDATGREVPTSYRLEGTVLVQTVAHSGNYPVVADPHYTWGWVTGTAYYDRAETKSLKTYSFALIVAGGLCAAFAWQTAGASCAISAALFSQWQYVASNAHGEGRCVKIKIPTFWAYAYSGGHCR
jgi:hypothetical protein